MRNLPLTFDYSTYSRKEEEDFAKFCGLLRIYELYKPGEWFTENCGAYKATNLGMEQLRAEANLTA